MKMRMKNVAYALLLVMILGTIERAYGGCHPKQVSSPPCVQCNEDHHDTSERLFNCDSKSGLSPGTNYTYEVFQEINGRWTKVGGPFRPGTMFGSNNRVVMRPTALGAAYKPGVRTRIDILKDGVVTPSKLGWSPMYTRKSTTSHPENCQITYKNPTTAAFQRESTLPSVIIP